MTQSILDVKQLSVILGDTPVLSQIDVRIPRGSIVCIVGPNGAGKTTLLKCINHIHCHYTGDIFIEGHSTRTLSHKTLARKIGYVPQVGTETPPPFTVRDFMRLSRYPHHRVWHSIVAEEKTIIDDALIHACLQHMSDRLLSSLSGGERQKAFIAAALVQESDILLLDEPTSFLDYHHQTDIADILRNISRKQGRTVIMVTHDINWALQMADYILALRSGRAVWFGPSCDFLDLDLLSSIFSTSFRIISDPELNIPLLMVRGKSS